MADNTFLKNFPNHIYRYIDQTGDGRAPVSSVTPRPDLNEKGYDAYFTVNGFKDTPDAKKNHCTNINAFFVDIDGRKDLAELEAIRSKLEPTYIVETKNGYHIYFLLEAPIYKEKTAQWNDVVGRWEKIEESIVSTLNADRVVKDLTRILRIPGSYYWKKSGQVYKEGVTAAPFKIKGIHKNLSARYTIDQIAEAFPIKAEEAATQSDNLVKYAEQEKADFFRRVNDKFPVAERESFLALISGKRGTLPEGTPSRNQALLVTASMMREAGWTKPQAIAQINKVGWHGIESERNGAKEILNTINSAYHGKYTFSYKNPIIAHNMTAEEQQKMTGVYTSVAKDKKDTDKVRFSNYEYEIFARFPNLKRSDSGMIFNYRAGTYYAMADQDVDNLILTGLYDDMLWGYRTKRHISDKRTCLLSIIPDLALSEDFGQIFNVKNGLLNIQTQILHPHTPDFVSLIQSPVSYDPKAEAPTWLKCMDAWMEGDEKMEKIKLLQQYCGYCLSSSMNRSAALFIIGDGGNGKSTFVDALAMVLGDKATSNIDMDDLYSDFGLFGLVGKRLNVVEEVSGNYYESHKLKKLISGEEVTVNVKYHNQFKFRPQAKFVFVVNTMPRVDDTSVGTERRILAVQFLNNFRANPNHDLRFASGLLAQELAGILNWMIEGAILLKQEGQFVHTLEQKVLMSEYRQENSSIDGFIAECLELAEGISSTTRSLYNKYKIYCQMDGRKSKSNIAFTKELKAYARRATGVQFIERSSGGQESRFVGLQPNREWVSINSPYDASRVFPTSTVLKLQ